MTERSDRGEAWRVYALALFYLKRHEGARVAFLEYLKLDVDARLDPAQVPPEVVAFFEGVRARNAAELRRYRPKPKKRTSWALNLLPPLGQLQNGQQTKGLVIAGVGGLALIGNVGSYILLRTWCSEDTGVCTSNGDSREGEARILRNVNIATGVILVGTLAYGIIDGFINSRSRKPRMSVSWTPLSQGGAAVTLRTRF